MRVDAAATPAQAFKVERAWGGQFRPQDPQERTHGVKPLFHIRTRAPRYFNERTPVKIERSTRCHKLTSKPPPHETYSGGLGAGICSPTSLLLVATHASGPSSS